MPERGIYYYGRAESHSESEYPPSEAIFKLISLAKF